MRDKAQSQSTQRAVDVLCCFLDGEAALGITELARRTGLPKTIVHRLASTLAANGFLEKDDPSAKYRMGPIAFRVGSCFLRGRRIETEAMPVMRKVVDKCGHPCHLAIPHRDEGIIVAMVDSPLPVKVAVGLGARRDLHATAIGKCMLAYQPPEEIHAALRRMDLTRRTERTITSRAALLRQLAEIRRDGYAFNDQESTAGIQAIAAPIFDMSGAVRAALGIPFPANSIPRSEIERLAGLAVDAAKEISTRMGRVYPADGRRARSAGAGEGNNATRSGETKRERHETRVR